MNLKKQIVGGLTIYVTVRFFSYLFNPTTPLYNADPINWLVSAGILGAVIYFLLKKDIRGWLIIAAELILGGAGSFLEIGGIALRTILLIAAMGIFVFQAIAEKKYLILWQNKYTIFITYGLVLAACFAATIGYLHGHSLKLILADLIPYLFFLYYLPLSQLITSENFRHITFRMILAAIIGNFLFIYGTLIGFSTKLFVLQDNYYHWFRDVASGKITDYATGFFRIVLNEQLLLIPLFLILFSYQLKKDDIKHCRLIALASILLLAILTINLTRIYLVALAIGILLLFSFKNWKKWFAYSAAATSIFISIFALTNLAATKGRSLGLEYLGLRLQSIAAPTTEDSSLSRTLLLPKIWNKIKTNPVMGSGLGDTVTVYSPVFKQEITTPHFDWGYLEIWAEMGLIGLAAWIILIGYILWLLRSNLASGVPLIALLTTNLTSPALFHVMGIIFITILLAKKVNPNLPSTQA
jgi:O-antigen ligase